MTKRIITTPTRPADYHRNALSPSDWGMRQKSLEGAGAPPTATSAAPGKVK